MRNSKKKFFWPSVALATFFFLMCVALYFVLGYVPKTKTIPFNKNLEIELPFSVSRWWDILIAPFWVIIITIVFNAKRVRSEKNFLSEFIFLGIFLGCGISLLPILGLFKAGLICFFVCSLISGFFVGFAFNEFFKSINFNIKLIPGAGLGAFLSTGIILSVKNGFIVGLIEGISVGLGTCLGAFLGAILKKIFEKIKIKLTRYGFFSRGKKPHKSKIAR